MRELAGLQTEGLPLEPASEKNRSGHAEREGHQQVEGKLRQHGRELLRQRPFEKADRDDANDPVLPVEDRGLPARRDAEGAVLDTDPGLSGKDRVEVLID